MVNFKLLPAGALVLSLIGGCAINEQERAFDFSEQITQERKAELADIFLTYDEHGTVIFGGDYEAIDDDGKIVEAGYNSAMRPYESGFYQFTNDELARKGHQPFDYSSLILKIHEDAPCRANSHACAKGNGREVNMTATTYRNAVRTADHENGHIWLGRMYEGPSMIMEGINAIKRYQYEPRVGSLSLENMFSSPGETPLEELPAFDQMYALGKLLTPVYINLHDGDLEATRNKMAVSFDDDIRIELFSELEKLPGETPAEKAYHAWGNLLSNPNFHTELASGMTHDEFNLDEFIDYLEIMRRVRFAKDLPNTAEIKEEAITRAEAFASNPHYTNTYFRGKAAGIAGNLLYDKIATFIDENYAPDRLVYLPQTLKLVAMYDGFNCDGPNQYVCPDAVREIYLPQVHPYILLAKEMSHHTVRDVLEFPSYEELANQFLRNYYPGTDVDAGVLGEPKTEFTHNSLVYLAYKAGRHFYRKKYDSEGNPIPEMAAKANAFYALAQEVECQGKDEESLAYERLIDYNMCANLQWGALRDMDE